MEYSVIDDSLGSFSEVFEKKISDGFQDQENPVKLQECSVNHRNFISEEFESPLQLDEYKYSVNDESFIPEKVESSPQLDDGLIDDESFRSEEVESLPQLNEGLIYDESFRSEEVENSDSESTDLKNTGTEVYTAPENIIFPKKIIRNIDIPLKRKKARNPSQWKSEKAKKAKTSGTSGTSKTNTPIYVPVIGLGCVNCRFGFQKKITITQRRTIFDEFWKIEDHSRQWDYIARHMQSTDLIANDNSENRRKISNLYYLKIGDKMIKVCSTMFLHTLGISQQWIRTINKKLQNSNRTSLQCDQRGKHSNKPKKMTEDTKKGIRDHIMSFPTVASHYCRQTSSKTYLQEGLSLQIMYDMYKALMVEKTQDRASEHLYRHIFNYEFNMEFHKPKKDLCDQCTAYSYLSHEDKKIHAPAQDLHLENKALVRQLMEDDKQTAKNDLTICTACFDVEQTLSTPLSNVSIVYYKRKINIYNFTIFEMASCQGWCFIWNETVGGKGANEISSCLWQFIKVKANSGVKEFRFYSDNCGAQNRNKMLYSMYMRESQMYKIKIIHRYLEKGHTYNEGDSMHARIENSYKNKAVFTQGQWCDIMRFAKRSKPYYIVHEVSQEEIFDFRVLAQDQNWKSVKISITREIAVSPDETQISVRYKYTEEPHLIQIDTKKSSENKYPLNQLYME